MEKGVVIYKGCRSFFILPFDLLLSDHLSIDQIEEYYDYTYTGIK
jgi:hypothetical protein